MNMLIHLLLTSGYFRLVYPMFRYFASKTVGFLSVWSWVGKLISWLYFSEIQHCHCASCKVEKTQKGRTVFQAGVFKCEPLLIFMILVSGWAPKPDLGKKSILTHFPTSLKTLKMTKLPNFPLFWVRCLTDFMNISQPSQKQPARWLVPVPCTCRWLDHDEWHIIPMFSLSFGDWGAGKPTKTGSFTNSGWL